MQACEARTSYLPNEILWGHRLEPAMSRDTKMGGYLLDYSKIDKTYQVNNNTVWLIQYDS